MYGLSEQWIVKNRVNVMELAARSTIWDWENSLILPRTIAFHDSFGKNIRFQGTYVSK